MTWFFSSICRKIIQFQVRRWWRNVTSGNSTRPTVSATHGTVSGSWCAIRNISRLSPKWFSLSASQPVESSRECSRTSLAARKCFSSRLASNHFSVNTFFSVCLFSCGRPTISLLGRSRFILCGVVRDLFNIAGTAGHRISVSDVFRANPSHWVCGRRLANDCWNVQLISTATFLHHDIRHRLLNAGLQIFAVVYRIAGSVLVSSVVCTGICDV